MEQVKAVFSENWVQIHGNCFWILASHLGLDGKFNEILKLEGRAESIQHSAVQCRLTSSYKSRAASISLTGNGLSGIIGAPEASFSLQ